MIITEKHLSDIETVCDDIPLYEVIVPPDDPCQGELLPEDRGRWLVDFGDNFPGVERAPASFKDKDHAEWFYDSLRVIPMLIEEIRRLKKEET